MGRSNANRAQQKRERNQAKAKASAGGKSQLASNAASMSIKCKVCMQAFMSTMRPSDLKLHQENKHPKSTYEACFPDQEKP